MILLIEKDTRVESAVARFEKSQCPLPRLGVGTKKSGGISAA
jgi:hypothetical protein